MSPLTAGLTECKKTRYFSGIPSALNGTLRVTTNEIHLYNLCKEQGRVEFTVEKSFSRRKRNN